PGFGKADLVGEADGAVGLNGPVDGAKADLYRVDLGHGKFLDRRLALIEQRGRVQPHQMRRVQLRRGDGEREGNALIFGNRLAEGDALLGVFERELDRPAADADGARRVVDAPERDAVKRRGKAVIELTNKLPRLDAEILEYQFGLIAADMAEQLDDPLDNEARRIGRHEKGGDAALFRRRLFRVRHREKNAVIGNRRVRGPDFPPVDEPAVAVFAGAGL